MTHERPPNFYVEDAGGVQALDSNLRAHWAHGWSVQSGCKVVAEDGTLDPDQDVPEPERTLRVEPGRAFTDRTDHHITQTNVDLGASDSNPRWDLVYVAPDGSIATAQGDPEPARPQGVAAADPLGVRRPAPPDLSDIAHDSGTPLAIVWIPGDANAIDNGDIFDRRMPADSMAAQNLGEVTATATTIETELDTEIPAGYSETVVGPYTWEGELTINGRLEII